MRDVRAEAETEYLQLILHNDNETPEDFVLELVRSVFDKPAAEAMALTAKVNEEGHAVCGTYPSAVAEALLKTSQQRIRAFGYPLLVTAEALPVHDGTGTQRCDFCGATTQEGQILIRGKTAHICDRCILTRARNLSELSGEKHFKYAYEAL